MIKKSAYSVLCVPHAEERIDKISKCQKFYIWVGNGHPKITTILSKKNDTSGNKPTNEENFD